MSNEKNKGSMQWKAKYWRFIA